MIKHYKYDGIDYRLSSDKKYYFVFEKGVRIGKKCNHNNTFDFDGLRVCSDCEKTLGFCQYGDSK